MAAFGGIPTNFEESLSMGSLEDLEICCDPCLSDGQNAEAEGFCLKCQENLCKLCLDAHKGVRVLKHHQIEDKPRGRSLTSTAEQDQSNICKEMCAIHRNETIKFFCQNHEMLGCSDCVTLDHRNCEIDYIPDICTNIKSTDFQKTLEEVTEKLKQSDNFKKETQTCKTNSKQNIADTIKEVEDFQKKMNKKLNTLKDNLVQNLNAVESALDRNVNEVLSRNDEICVELKLIRAQLESSQTSGHAAKAFVALKQTQASLKTLDISVLTDKLLAEARTYKFEPNEALKDILSTLEELGKIVTVEEKQSVYTAYTLFSLTHDRDINVKGNSDITSCDVSACALMSPGKLMVTDWNNRKLKIVALTKQSVVEECTLSSGPYDIAVLPHDQVAVTLPASREILILKTREKLVTLHNIDVNRPCYGIAYHQDLLYVVCQDPHSVLVLDLQGAVQRDIQLKSAPDNIFRNPCRIIISKGLRQMYISDWNSNMVVSFTLKGQVIAVYRNEELKNPWGITMLDDSSLLVCCPANGTIHHISAGLTLGRKVAKGISNAKSVCYDSASNQICVSGYCNNVRLFTKADV